VTVPPLDADSLWKEVLECFLPDFLAFCLPAAHAGIDWARGYQFLDKELQEVAPAAAVGRRVVDALVQVWRRDGAAAWVLSHIEVQGREEAAFARRMYGYHARLLERFDRPVVSLAVLTDARANWRPARYTSALWGCAVEFSYPVVKLIDYRAQREALAASPNPFATVVLAHLAALETRRDPAGRARAKLTLARRLYERGYDREQIIGLFRFIDWIMRLPAALEAEVWQQLRQDEEARGMPYITSVERIGMQQGLEQGLEQGRQEGPRRGLLAGLEVALAAKFGAEGERFFADLRAVEEVAVLAAVAERLKTAATLAEVQALLVRPAGEPEPGA
jgi:hypothetical protein